MANIFTLSGEIILNIRDVINNLRDVDDRIDDVRDNMDDLEDSSDSAGDSAIGFGEKLGKINDVGQKVSGIITGIATACVGMTQELSMGMAKLETTSSRANVSWDTTNKAVKEFIGLGADTDQAYEAMSNLLMAGVGEENISDVVSALNGAIINFPDTLNIESLADSLQEMAGSGVVTGQMAELFDRLGINTSELGDQLLECGSESDRLNLLLTTLSNTGLADVNEAFQKENEALIESNKSQYNFKEACAELGQTLTPIFTKVTELVSKLVGWFNNLSPSTQKWVIVGAGVVFLLTSLISGISGLVTGLGVLGVTVNLAFLPWIAVIGAVVAVVVLLWNKCEWFRDGVKAIWEAIKDAFKAVWDWIVDNFKRNIAIMKIVIDALKNAWDSVCNFFSNAWDKVTNGIKAVFQGVRDTVVGIAQGMVNTVIGAINWCIKALNKLSFKVPKWVPGIGGKKFGFDIKEIKEVNWLYDGAIFNAPTQLGAYGVGDAYNGKGKQAEAVVPIDKLKDMIRDVLTIDFRLDIDGREFVTKVVAPYQDELVSYGRGR